MSKQREALVILKKSLNEIRGYTSLEFDQKQIDDDIRLIDEALNDAGQLFDPLDTIQSDIAALRQEINWQNGGVLRNALMDLPDRIREQQLDMTNRADDIEDGRLELEKIKNGHREFVLNAKEDGKPKFGNDKARDLAVAMLLQDDKKYNDLLDSVKDKERLQRLAEIDLRHLGDKFKAHLAITEMMGVK